MSSAPPIPRSDLQLLRRPTPSRYRNVYVCGKDSYGNTRYVAKVKMGGRLRCLPGSRSTLPEESAACVVRWYLRVYGDLWRDALAARKRCPWAVWRAADGSWRAAVWLWGGRVLIPEWTVRGGRAVGGSGPKSFPSRDAAERGVRRYVRDTLGLLALVAVWRVGPGRDA